MLPVKFLQAFVAFKLFKNTIVINQDIHVSADILPLREFLRIELDFRHQTFENNRINFFTDFSSFVKEPHCHDICIGIIFHPLLSTSGKGFMKLVRPHHAFNVILVRHRRKGGD